MTNKEIVLMAMKMYGKAAAESLQIRSAEMTDTEIIAESDFLPMFDSGKQYLNVEAGYVCKTISGYVVKLTAPYDSSKSIGQPETLPSVWKFLWSSDPSKAVDFVVIENSPYMTGDCCLSGGLTWRSTVDENITVPDAENPAWETI